VKASDYEPNKTDRDYVRGSDVPWLDRFAAAGGHAVISGDTKMGRRRHEKLCLYEHGFVTVFFERQWNGWNFFRKTALLLHWWEEVANKIKVADKGTFWVVPAAWPTKGAFRVSPQPTSSRGSPPMSGPNPACLPGHNQTEN